MCVISHMCVRVSASVCVRVSVCEYVCALGSVWRYVFATTPAFSAAGRKYLLNEVAFVSVV